MKNYLAILTLWVLSFGIFAQSIEIQDVKRSRFNGVKPIFSGEDMKVEGYYTYYMIEKGSNGDRLFEFALIDKEVKDAKKIQVTINKSSNINNTIFNGKYFLISWDDVKDKKMVFNTIATDGTIIANKEIPVEKRRLAASTVYASIDGEGFYIVSPQSSGASAIGYSIERVNNKLEQIWKVDDIPAKGSKEVEDLINLGDRFVIWENYCPNMNPNKVVPQLVAFNSKTSEQIYINDSFDGTHTGLYNRLRLDEDGSVLIGGSYVNGQKIKDVNNEGIYIKKLDPNGKEILYTKVSNSEKIQEVLKSTSKGFAIGSKDKVLVEDLIVDKEGNIVIISEMFSKNLNITPLAIQQTRDLISGGKSIGAPNNNDKSKYTLEIKDFILFKFNQKGELGEIKPISKEDYNKITVYNPYSSYGGMKLARTLREMGWFDYGFTTTNVDGKSIMVCKNNANPKRPEAFFYSLDENYAFKQINLKKMGNVNLDDAAVGYFDVLRGVTGNVVIAFFQGKLKKITIQSESLIE
ncbi:MAG: hypothetical protein JXA68_01155 [Ignavibacteriales bacterium]|nr:hypothetical protein [Ignavibacteriales bacterium]